MKTKVSKKALPTNLKNDVPYLRIAYTSAPTARERSWAKRQLDRIFQKKHQQ